MITEHTNGSLDGSVRLLVCQSSFLWCNITIACGPKSQIASANPGNKVTVFPLAIMSFNRPAYLARVVYSIKAQSVAIPDGKIFLFQDGYKDPLGADITDPRLIESCCEIFISAFPNGKIFLSEMNLGVALNFHRAEEFFFSTRQDPAAMFFEDDLILSEHYFYTLEKLINTALSEPRLGYVAAYGDHRASLQSQLESKSKLMLMRHKWGFGLTRRQWSLQNSLMQPYLEIVARDSYFRRDHGAIMAYYRKLGLASPGTSQDGMKDVAAAVLGTTKIMTYACFGEYIGENGLHSNKDLFEREGYGSTQMLPFRVEEFEKVTPELLDTCIAEERRAALEALSHIE